MGMRQTLFLGILFWSFFLLSIGGAHAQTDFDVTKIQEILSESTIPEIPEANQKVSISIESSSYDLNNATISWYLDDELNLSEVGRKSFSFINGEVGEETEVVVVISPKQGAKFEKVFRFRPAGVSLIWEADTYTPALYKGKAAFSNESLITIVASPDFVDRNGRRLAPETLTYTWKRNGTVLGSFSGYGKSVLKFYGSVLGIDEKIEVDVMSPDKSIRALGSTTLRPSNPETLLYENHPLYGTLFNKAIDSVYTLKEKEVSLVAVPYFFNTKSNLFEALSFNWFLNGAEVKNGSQKDTITLRNDAGASGTSRLRLDVQNILNNSQATQNSLSINLSN